MALKRGFSSEQIGQGIVGGRKGRLLSVVDFRTSVDMESGVLGLDIESAKAPPLEMPRVEAFLVTLDLGKEAAWSLFSSVTPEAFRCGTTRGAGG